jgi:hypothetical protein
LQTGSLSSLGPAWAYLSQQESSPNFPRRSPDRGPLPIEGSDGGKTRPPPDFKKQYIYSGKKIITIVREEP